MKSNLGRAVVKRASRMRGIKRGRAGRMNEEEERQEEDKQRHVSDIARCTLSQFDSCFLYGLHISGTLENISRCFLYVYLSML